MAESYSEDGDVSVEKIPMVTDTNTLEMEQFIHGFLTDLKCIDYLPLFTQYGLLDENDVKYIDKEILVAMGITKIGDRIRILRKAKGLDKKVAQAHEQDTTEQLNDIISKIGSLSMSISTGLHTTDFAGEKNHAIFILNDGSAKKVNIDGCFNADSIKKRLLKRLPVDLLADSPLGGKSQDVSDYDVFVVDYTKNVLHLLYDVELVTICHSADRIEKNRLIFVSKYQSPGEKAISLSKKLYIKMSTSGWESSSVDDIKNHASHPDLRRNKLPIDNSHEGMRKIFNQRPPSELISTNLSGYFPTTDVKKLQKTLRDSYRHSILVNPHGKMSINPESNNIGDILLKHSSAVDSALLQSLPHNQPLASHSSATSRTTQSDNSGFISLYAEGSDYEDEMEEENMETADMVSLPTKIETPKAWLKGARIGAGSFGSVYLGMNATTGELMAVKQVSIQPIIAKEEKQKNGNDKKSKRNISDIHKKMVDALQHEMSLLKELHHENIVTYYGSSQEGGNINIFLEYVPGGSVSSMLNNYGPFEESLIINFTRQILIGVAYLHRKNIIHRDIKGANILIDIKGCVKITDFGISKKLSPFNSKPRPDKRASLQGSVFWMAPEVVKQTATTSKVDIWSTGCVVIEMFTGKHPFPDFSQMQAIFKIGTNTSPDVPSWASEVSCNFLKRTFELNFKQRPSAVDLLQHPWLDAKIV
ncbi:similar to Saccharomyces cerevisiae YLR362W STE11 Signal transducing MEK kinase involved in pheromone response and pseudohyphal/invasive growth pathways where it phosphorylates Ste7p [Maudiozyma barnettii]|uniref:mitogen-activated protein kinase kinase kinase n=1 Tax=Maudiozyma barnettii TaxID=61262 RepID=A0A8H2ZK77_9SACH|nr:mitogen-activated protein kinase kinase kinase STE11 [Kazachstania barnettii]CAB4257282.1 similar to Saccharomyces cerevisiae YLR362W STE11 Signal transducing MEK kinase involved in pheromone response and pseudohyphal/invasive growth pathways where it phosphorylates Ste7p [Kazachstania barnettii]CAD1784547.1 similar to Saccharomyces cerevisiae YLR362W STE11 Signal transducing MEK kinase involved in pheromone response and pseudohyphal/invasive growth pathways where it phosphorylates Ste7p [Kaza